MNLFITGANQGIGYYLAAQALEEGNAVSVLDVETDRLAALAAAVVIVWGGSLMLAWAVPYLEPRTLVLSRDMLDSAQIYTILNRINPFAWLCF